MRNRRDFLRTMAGAATPLGAAAPPRKPNFLVILADDMGYSDAGCYGGEIETPNLDALARRGLRFTQGYSTARCGPSRSCLLTGYYAQQTASDRMTPGNIPAWTRFLPHYLKPLGYRCYHSGKWQMRFRPLQGAGFDHSYALHDENRYFTPTNQVVDEEKLPRPKEGEGYYATTAIADYAIRWLQDHARHDPAAPFFLYLAFTAPHFPLQALREDIQKYRDRYAEGWDAVRQQRYARMKRMGLIRCDLSPLEPEVQVPWNTPEAELLAKIGPGEVTRAVPWSALTAEQKKFQALKMAIYAAMITRMDREIGRVLAQLKAMHAFEDTVIFFLSDNGSSSELIIRADGHDAAAEPGSARTHLCLGPGWSSAANTPFRRHKSWVHEGGIASPWIVHWPAGIRAGGQLRHTPCHFIDVPATMLELAGAKLSAVAAPEAPPLPGLSLVPLFTKDGAVEHEFLYFHHSNNRALRMGRWKIVAAGKEGPWELYDMESDRSETRNLASAQPDRVQNMAAVWKRWDEEFVRRRESARPMPKDRL